MEIDKRKINEKNLALYSRRAFEIVTNTRL